MEAQPHQAYGQGHQQQGGVVHPALAVAEVDESNSHNNARHANVLGEVEVELLLQCRGLVVCCLGCYLRGLCSCFGLWHGCVYAK
jgi:hypothetical protein